jgi:Mg-chelatase subunit ChlI
MDDMARTRAETLRRAIDHARDAAAQLRVKVELTRKVATLCEERQVGPDEAADLLKTMCIGTAALAGALELMAAHLLELYTVEGGDDVLH